MFNKNNFCHVASNNRNEKKAGIFVYKTTDDLATVTTSGYFNDKIVDINLHDLIIHEWHNPADRTKVEKNVLCVTERTLDNVGTAVIKSKWEADIEEIIEHLSDTYVLKAGDTMTGPLNIIDENGTEGALITLRNGTNDTRTWRISASSTGPDLQFTYLASGITRGYAFIGNGIIPLTNNFSALGNNNHHWTKAYVNALNNGYDIAVPVTAEADTLALKSQVDLAANSGSQLRDKGVWYAKMDAATTPPSSAGVEGRNYADFTQVDQDNNPIIVIYTYTSGAWQQTETITPPASYNGYLPITSKFWDIQEQAGQQGGEVLWSYSAKTFTPYPRIISTDGIAITNSTFSNGTLTNVITTMPDSPVAKTVTNKQYVDNAITAALAGYDTPDLFEWKWRDATTSKTTWKLSDGNWINRADAETAWDHLQYDAGYETTSYPWVQLQAGTPKTFIRAADFDETGADYPYAYANITNGVLTLRYSTSSTGGSGVTGPIYYDGPNAGASGWGAEYGGTMTSATLKIETVAGISVMCWLGEDGHKIVRPAWRPSLQYDTIVSGQDTAVDAIYAATGVAWYYIFDGSNQRFKLPRSKHEHYGDRPVIGNGKSVCYTNGSATDVAILSREGTSSPATDAQTGAYTGNLGNISGTGWYNGELGLSTDPTKSGIISTPVQDIDQYKYLYFYVGQ